jgi:hypothetical protein
VREGSLALRTQRDDAPGYAHSRRRRGQLVGRAAAELLGDEPGGVRGIELVRVGRVAQRLNFTQLLAALLELVERLKFQRDDPFKGEALQEIPRKYITGPNRKPFPRKPVV